MSSPRNWWSMKVPPRLPQEIIDYILSSDTLDTKTLKSCATVSWSFAVPSQLRLLRKMCISTSIDDCERFETWLDQRTEVITQIQSLSIDFSRTRFRPDVMNDLRSIVRKLKSLRTLVFRTSVDSSRVLTHTILQRLIQPHIQDVHFDGGTEISYHGISSIINATKVYNLTISGPYDHDSRHTNPLPKKKLMKLDTLTLQTYSSVDAKPFFPSEFVSFPCNWSTLRQLKLHYPTFPPDHHHHDQLLNLLPSLTRLQRLSLSFSPLIRPCAWTTATPILPRLQSFSAEIFNVRVEPTSTLDGAFSWLFLITRHLDPSSPLNDIHLTVHFDSLIQNRSYMKEWTQLDEIAESGCRLILTIVSGLVFPAEKEEIMRCHLPKLSADEKLLLRFETESKTI